jgi:Fur family peroxide stress response transcriptional regulator
MRYSRQRELILETLKNFENHPTAEQLYLRVKDQLPSLSLGTVYRNLNLLVELGEIRKVESVGSSSVRYDARRDEHCHLVCISCNSITDIDLDYFSTLDDKIKNEFNFIVKEHEVVLKGICSNCSSAEK